MQTMPLVVDVDEFTSRDEETVLRNSGFELVRLRSTSIDSLPESPRSRLGILRSTRVNEASYNYLYEELGKRNISLVNTPAMSSLASEFRLHYPLIIAGSPRAVVVPSDTALDDVRAAIRAGALHFPVFVKTEAKSLKSRSLVKTDDRTSVDLALAAIVNELAPFSHFVIKEVVDIDGEDCRGFVCQHRLVSFDTGDPTLNPERSDNTVVAFMQHWIRELEHHSFADFYVIDVVPLRHNAGCVIIEIKDAQFTRVKRPALFWPKLAQQFSQSRARTNVCPIAPKCDPCHDVRGS